MSPWSVLNNLAYESDQSADLAAYVSHEEYVWGEKTKEDYNQGLPQRPSLTVMVHKLKITMEEKQEGCWSKVMTRYMLL